MRSLILPATTALILTGCQPFMLQGYVSPRVVGRVTDAETGAPLAQASVRRVTGREVHSNFPPKGGELLLDRDETRTDSEGRFRLRSERVALGFSAPLSARLVVRAARYDSLRAEFGSTNITFPDPKGPPVLNTGDLRMHRTRP